MVCAIHQLHYLPWLRYFEKIARSDVFIVLDNIQYNKNGWQNRNKIKTPTGPTLLTVPVHAPLGCTLDEVLIDDSQPWRKKHWATIQQSYRRAAYFDQHEAFLAFIYSREWKKLNHLNWVMLEYFASEMEMETSLVLSSELNVPGTGTQRLVNLIENVGAKTYYSGAYALEQYLDIDRLTERGLFLQLQDWHAPVYQQLHGEFVPELSILDLLLNCGPSSREVLLGSAQK